MIWVNPNFTPIRDKNSETALIYFDCFNKLSSRLFDWPLWYIFIKCSIVFSKKFSIRKSENEIRATTNFKK